MQTRSGSGGTLRKKSPGWDDRSCHFRWLDTVLRCQTFISVHIPSSTPLSYPQIHPFPYGLSS